VIVAGAAYVFLLASAFVGITVGGVVNLVLWVVTPVFCVMAVAVGAHAHRRVMAEARAGYATWRPDPNLCTVAAGTVVAATGEVPSGTSPIPAAAPGEEAAAGRRRHGSMAGSMAILALIGVPTVCMIVLTVVSFLPASGPGDAGVALPRGVAIAGAAAAVGLTTMLVVMIGRRQALLKQARTAPERLVFLVNTPARSASAALRALGAVDWPAPFVAVSADDAGLRLLDRRGRELAVLPWAQVGQVGARTSWQGRSSFVDLVIVITGHPLPVPLVLRNPRVDAGIVRPGYVTVERIGRRLNELARQGASA